MKLASYRRKNYSAVSFEGDSVKVAYLEEKGRSLFVRDVVTIEDSEFDAFLKATPAREFIVVNDFRVIYQDVLSLPPAETKYIKSLAEAEIRKHFTGVSDFSFFYSFLGTEEHEGKKVKEVFVYAVGSEDLGPLIDRFIRHDKTVVALYPSIVPLTAALRSYSAPQELLLCVLDLGLQKTLFLVKDGQIRFVRVTQSHQKGISELDVDSINMTANYFRQTLRLNPSKIVFAGIADYTHESVSGLIAPSTVIQHPEGIIAPPHVVAEYILPISSVLFHKTLHWGNLLPQTYRSLGIQRKVVSLCIVLFFAFSFLSLSSMIHKLSEVSRLKGKIDELKRDISLKLPVFDQFENRRRDVEKIKPFIQYINKTGSSPDVQRALASIRFLPMEKIRVNSVQLSTKEDGLFISIQGNIAAKNYTDMDAHYRDLLEKIKGTKGLEVSTQSLDLKSKTFTVEMKWKT